MFQSSMRLFTAIFGIVVLQPSAFAKNISNLEVGCVIDGRGNEVCLDVDRSPGWKDFSTNSRWKENGTGRTLLTLVRTNSTSATWAVGHTDNDPIMTHSTCFIACRTVPEDESTGPSRVIGLVSIPGYYDTAKICRPNLWSAEDTTLDARLSQVCQENFSHGQEHQENFTVEGNTFYWLLHTAKVLVFSE